jgi:predicted oxidoreductase
VADRAALERRVRERKAADMVAVAEELGADVRRSETVAGLSLGALGGDGRLRAPPFVAVPVAAAVTHTVAGLAADTSGRVLDERGSPLPGLFAAGVDVGGVASGGYASGLAQALVQGLAAAETD